MMKGEDLLMFYKVTFWISQPNVEVSNFESISKKVFLSVCLETKFGCLFWHQ